jgi:hypothetical protein
VATDGPARRQVLTGLAALALAGCAGPAPYGPARGGGPGYAEARIKPGRWRVRYRGAAGASRETVELNLLRRAAEITLEQGGGHFRLISRDVDYAERRSPGVVFGAPWGGWSSSDGFFGGVSLAVPVGSSRYEAAAEILVARGPAPPGAADAYDARAVLRSLAPEG